MHTLLPPLLLIQVDVSTAEAVNIMVPAALIQTRINAAHCKYLERNRLDVRSLSCTDSLQRPEPDPGCLCLSPEEGGGLQDDQALYIHGE